MVISGRVRASVGGMTDDTEAPAIDGMAVLVDAIARGRLSVAELCGLSPEELEVLGELGAQHLDTGRDREAVRIFGGLVALFPYAARHWRGYAVALHRIGAWEQARASYDAALLLEPDVLEMFCYRGEVLLYLGEINAARPDLERAMESAYPEIRQRAEELLRCARELQGWTPPPRRVIAVDRSGGFSLGDGRALPLKESPLEESEPEVDPVDAEATQVHQQRGWEDTQIRIMVPLSRERTAQVPALEEQKENRDSLKNIGALPRLETSTTGLMFAPNEGTDTALIPGRGGSARPAPISQDGTDTALLPGRGETEEFPVEHTAISRRRMGLPLMHDEATETYTEDPLEEDDL